MPGVRAPSEGPVRVPQARRRSPAQRGERAVRQAEGVRGLGAQRQLGGQPRVSGVQEAGGGQGAGGVAARGGDASQGGEGIRSQEQGCCCHAAIATVKISALICKQYLVKIYLSNTLSIFENAPVESFQYY